MHNNGTVVIVDDDDDDREILESVFKRLKYSNEIIFFKDGFTALQYLNNVEKAPLVILSDINMPKMDGVRLRKEIQESHNNIIKCVPFIFFTTASTEIIVRNAYSSSIQGFFVKAISMDEIESTISIIIEYWKRCLTLNDF